MKIIRVEPQAEVREAYKPSRKRKKLVTRPARHLGHPHPLTGGGTGAAGADLHRHPLPDAGATRTPRPSRITKGHREMVERNLSLLAEADPALVRGEVEIFKEKAAALVDAPLTPARRAHYAALEAHREMASVILSAGGTFDEAADHAGVARGTVARWYEEPSFRARVDEQRALVKNRVGGKIEAWMEERVADPAALRAADPKITLAIYDRVAGAAGGRGAGAGAAGQGAGQPGTVVNILTYGDLMEVAARAAARRPAQAEGDVVDAGGEGRGFPILGPGGLPVAGDGAQSD